MHLTFSKGRVLVLILFSKINLVSEILFQNWPRGSGQIEKKIGGLIAFFSPWYLVCLLCSWLVLPRISFLTILLNYNLYNKLPILSNSMNFSKFIELCYHHHNPVSATFITPKRSFRPFCSQCGSQTMNELLSVPIAFPLLGFSYKGNCTINIVFGSGFFHLTYCFLNWSML